MLTESHPFLKGANLGAPPSYPVVAVRHYSEQIFSSRRDADKPSLEVLAESMLNTGKREYRNQSEGEEDHEMRSVDESKEEVALKRKNSSNELSAQNEGDFNNGKWTDDEHKRFLEGLLRFGKNWNQIQKYIATRSCP